MLFFNSKAEFNPVEPWQLRLLVGSDAVSPPSFASFDLTYRVPESYVVKAAAALPSNHKSPGTGSTEPGDEMGTPEKALGWQAIWSSHQVRIAILGVGLAALTVILFLQDVISRRRRLHRVIRVGFLLWTLVWLGWYAGAQLTIVNLITYIHTLVTDFRWDYLLADPLVAILSRLYVGRAVPLGSGRVLWLALPVWRPPGVGQQRGTLASDSAACNPDGAARPPDRSEVPAVPWARGRIVPLMGPGHDGN